MSDNQTVQPTHGELLHLIRDKMGAIRKTMEEIDAYGVSLHNMVHNKNIEAQQLRDSHGYLRIAKDEVIDALKAELEALKPKKRVRKK